MYKNIVIIGVGSLGGFLAECVSKIKGLQSLILIDPDFVEKKNLEKSIYRINDIGKFKVYALRELIKEKIDNITIEAFPIEYIEGKSRLPENDLIIDCRDEIVSRCGEIDVRLYIAYSTLVVDCKKIHKIENKHSGRYIQTLNMFEISSVANTVSQQIYSGRMREFIRKQMIYHIPVDFSSNDAEKCIEEYNECTDVVYDYHADSHIIKNLYETLPKIVEANKTKALTIVIGEGGSINHGVEGIKKNEFADHNKAIQVLSEITKTLVPKQEYYTIKMNTKKSLIELLPETGAA